MSAIEKLSPVMRPISSPPASSSSSLSTSGEVTPAEVNSIQDRLMEDLSRLTRMLQRIQATLHDAEEREIHDKVIQLWLSELKEIAYDAEDVLDEYDYQVIKTQVERMAPTVEVEPSQKGKTVDDDDDDDDDDDLQCYQVPLPSSTSIKIPISYNMAKRIMKIIENFDEIMKDRVELQLRPEDAPRRLCLDDAMKRPPSSSFMYNSDVFGREDDKKKIIQLLMSDSGKVNTVIPIVGLGGVGKTTLAQFVYSNPTVCDYFSPKVWVSVSEDFDIMRITKEIVTSIMGSSNDHDYDNLNDIQRMLNKALQEKRFLFIFDDIWNERIDMWEALRAPFFGNAMGKIIVTTRSKSVARIMQTVPPIELGCLDEEKSWLLFQRHAFCGWELDQQLNFDLIGRQITRKCGGLPLALKAIGGFLRYEFEETWLDVLKNDQWELEETKNLILPALRISYNHLPAHLKPCFVYASMFPKDYEFKKEDLIKLWIAQGYIIQPIGRQKLLEDIAFEYFDDLWKRSLFQCSNHVNHFSLHNMVHDLARYITRNDICSLLDLNESNNIPKNAKHILINYDKATPKFPLRGAIRTFCIGLSKVGYSFSFNCDSEVLLQSNFFKDLFPHFGCLRALRIYAPHYECNLQFIDRVGNLQHLRYLSIKVHSIEMAEHSLCSLYKLQTLELQSYNLSMLPRAMGKLINLRHLVLCCDIKMLPKSICQVENLLTLDIHDCRLLRKLPLGISKLANLRHLMLPRIDNFCIACGIKNMINLQTLSHHLLRRCSQHRGIGWLKNLVNLRGTLKIYELQNVFGREDAMSANLRSKPHIQSLELFWGENTEDDECAKQDEAILDGLQPHTNLKNLFIKGYGGSSFPSWFGNPNFSNLTRIILKFFNSSEECKFLPLSGLPSLKSLFIENIKGIRRIGQDFWCYTPPDGRGNICTEVHVGFISLEILYIWDMPELEEWRMVKNSRDFPSLKKLHILRCPKLELLPTLPSNIQIFTIGSCERLGHLALHDRSGHPSRLQQVFVNSCDLLTSVEQVPNLAHLEIKQCFNLKSVNILDNILASLKILKLVDCPQLQLNVDECSHHSLASLSSEKGNAHVVNCPGMKEWCHWHGFTYSEESREIILSKTSNSSTSSNTQDLEG